MLDLNDTVFIIPARIDSLERRRNYLSVLHHLLKNFEAPIIVSEGIKDTTTIKTIKDYFYINYHFVVDESGLFNKCKYINAAVKRVEGEEDYILCILDADMIILPSQMQEAVNLIRKDEADLVIPFNRTCIDIFRASSKRLNKVGYENINKLDYTPLSFSTVGGAVLIRLSKFKEIGMMNENIKGLLGMDVELIIRASKFGLRMYEVAGYGIHLTHKKELKNKVQGVNTNELIANNLNLRNYINSLSLEELKNEIKKWEWLKNEQG